MFQAHLEFIPITRHRFKRTAERETRLPKATSEDGITTNGTIYSVLSMISS
jgi:hypothetical protein